jgi:long-chain fatty acid transport protein
MKKLRFKLSALAVGAALAGMAGGANAGGFAIGTQSGSGTGNAFAGGAAAVEDASVAWYNPAAMIALPAGRQVTVAAHSLWPSFEYKDQGSTGALAAPGTGDGGDGGMWALVPNAYFTMAIDPQWSFGLALNVPFGLATEYKDGWRGAITALKSEIKTINLNPSVGYKINDMFSIGAGFSYQSIEAELSRFSGVPALGDVRLEADDYGWGFNVGALFRPDPSLRIGLTYRSTIEYDLEGDVKFSGVAGGPLNGDVKADLKVPDSASLSLFKDLGPMWEVMADITWTGWSSVKKLQVICATPCGGGPAGATFTTLTFNWDDTWRFGIGANYKLNSQTKLRFGLASDQTPTNDTDRTARLPDEDRLWVAFGVQYKPSKSGVIEIGYAHEFVDDAKINDAAMIGIVPVGTLKGKFDNSADILSFQYSHLF